MATDHDALDQTDADNYYLAVENRAFRSKIAQLEEALRKAELRIVELETHLGLCCGCENH